MSSSPKTPCKELFFLFAEKEIEAEGKQRGCPRMEMWFDEVSIQIELG